MLPAPLRATHGAPAHRRPVRGHLRTWEGRYTTPSIAGSSKILAVCIERIMIGRRLAHKSQCCVWHALARWWMMSNLTKDGLGIGRLIQTEDYILIGICAGG